MGNVANPRVIGLRSAEPPPNSNYIAIGRRFIGRGSPENLVLGFAGDTYVNLDNGERWNKLSPTELPLRETLDGWEPENSDLADIRDYKVVPDSEDDQTDLIQTALTSTAAEGFVLLVPDGVYRHNPLTLDGPVRIRGTGKSKAIFKARDAYNHTNGLWTVQTGSEVIFEDVSLDGDALVNRVLRINAGANVDVRHSKISNAYGSVATAATVAGIIVGGGGKFRCLDSEVSDCSADPDGDNTGNVPGTVRGIHFTKWSTEDPPIEAIVSRSLFRNILSGTTRNEDADAISYQSHAQDSKGNVHIVGNTFHNIGKRWCKILSPGVVFAHNVGTNESTSLKPMYAIVSANSSNIIVKGNRCEGGAAAFFCDVGNPGTWACSNVTVEGNVWNQGSDPNVSAEGCRTMGNSGTLCTGVVISGNQFLSTLIGIHVSGGSVGVMVGTNRVIATEAGIHIGWRYTSEDLLGLPVPSVISVGNNVGTGGTYGVRWKALSVNCTPGFNMISAPDALICEGDPTLMFSSPELFNLQVIGGTLKGITAPVLVGSTTATTFTGPFTPQVQSINATAGAGKAGASVEMREGAASPLNLRAMLYVEAVEDSPGVFSASWGLDSTYSNGGAKPFKIRQGGVDWLTINGTNIIPAFSYAFTTGDAIDWGTSGSRGKRGYFQTGVFLGKASFGTGILTFENAAHAFLSTFKSSGSQAADWDYVFPADTPVAGDALRVASVVGSVVTLEWAP